mmetsp:Transcript_124016/g.386215  ORF Transcript_124016/g.386215 Transcript_124016/m.386215 type:complete len:201 (+) Transcript_124016:369-971(+)
MSCSCWQLPAATGWSSSSAGGQRTASRPSAPWRPSRLRHPAAAHWRRFCRWGRGCSRLRQSALQRASPAPGPAQAPEGRLRLARRSWLPWTPPAWALRRTHCWRHSPLPSAGQTARYASSSYPVAPAPWVWRPYDAGPPGSASPLWPVADGQRLLCRRWQTLRALRSAWTSSTATSGRCFLPWPRRPSRVPASCCACPTS